MKADVKESESYFASGETEKNKKRKLA